MSDADTSFLDVRTIHTCPKLLTALPAQRHTESTLYLTSPLDYTTPTCRARQDWPAPTHHDLRNSSVHSVPHLLCLVPPVTFTSRRRRSRSTH